MTRTTYTMFVEIDAGDAEIVARGVTAGKALSIALRRGGAGEPRLVSWSDGSHRFHAIYRDAGGERRDLVMVAKGSLSSDGSADEAKAAALFERAFLSDPARFWAGKIETDEEFARRRIHRKNGDNRMTEIDLAVPLEDAGAADSAAEAATAPTQESAKTSAARLAVFLPGFGGFHGMRWTDLFPFALQSCAERFARHEAADELTATDLAAILRETSEAPRFFAALAERYCGRYDAEISRWLGFELELKFAGFDIPRAHGGTTDFILATMPASSAGKLLARSAAEGHQRLLGSIRDRFAPLDGADPCPEDVVEEWRAQPIERWSRTELCDLLAGFVDPEIDERLYTDITGGSDVGMAFEAAVDWERFAATREAARRALPAAPAKL